jgi:glycosyltransferase involved in cell wall biosynthesis
MKIQFITSYPLHNEPVIRNRLAPFIKVANQYNYEVQVISSDDQPFEIEGDYFQHVTSADYVKKPRGFASRMWFEIKQARRLINCAKQYDADVRVITVPSMFLLFNVYLFRKRSFIIDLRDLTWEYIPETGFVSKLAKKIFRFLACKNIKKASFVNVTNDTEAEYLKNRFKVDKPILLVPNGVSQQQFTQLSQISEKQSGALSIAYIGNVGLAQNLRNLIDAAQHIPEVDFYIVGSGTDFKSVKDYAEQRNLSNLLITGRLPWSEVMKIYEKADVLYAQLSPDFSTAMPSKLYEYLSTGKYIIYGGQEQAAKILSNFDNNLVIEPCNSIMLEEAIKKVINDGLFTVSSNMNKKKIGKGFVREMSVTRVFDYLKSRK